VAVEERIGGYSCNHQAVSFGIMSKIARLFVVLLFVSLITGVVFLITWDIPAPSLQVEKVIPDDKFPH
jgi:phage shock protein PspC (stress-responsive transcriptional regulator)